MTFVAVHVATLLFDPYAQLRLVDIVVPFLGTYRPAFLGLGTLALDLLVAVVVTSLLRHRVGLRTWRAVHWSTWALWLVAVVHGLGTGTDATTPWLLAVDAVCVTAVAAALAWRVAAPPGRDRDGRTAPREPGVASRRQGAPL